MLRRSVLSLLALIAVAGGASAQPVVGPEFQVNTHTTAHQEYPAIAADANGNFVVVWNSDYQDGDAFGVFGQRFDRLGNPLGSEFAVNTITTAYQIGPSVAAHPSGSFVVVWSDGDLSGDYTEIFARRYDSSGSPLGAEFQVNTLVTGFQYNPDVAITPAGDFVVVWQSEGKDGDGYAVIGRRFDAAGNPLTPEFQLNAYTTSDQALPAVATTPTGEVVVAWVSDTQDGDGYGIFARAFSTSGSALGPEVRVNTYTASKQDRPDIAMDASGNFVVVWESRYQDDPFSYGIFGQRFDPTVNPVGLEFMVNTYTTNRQSRSSIAREADGHFVVMWNSTNQINATGDDIFAQRFDPAGAKVGLEFQVNTYTTNTQRQPVVASLGEEKFVVAWTSRGGQDGDGDGIFAQLFGDLIFSDGFE